MDNLMHRIARVMAYLGGTVLVALTVLTCVSIIGRSLVTIAHSGYVKAHMAWLSELLIQGNFGPIPGDFEILEAGIAFAVFAFLPWCQINNGHASVDIFTSRFPVRTNRLIDLVSASLMAVVFVVIAWRLWIAMGDKMRYGETTFILQFPIWWSYALSVGAAIVAGMVAVWFATVRLREFVQDQDILGDAGTLPQTRGQNH